jgi:hypothetical protein
VRHAAGGRRNPPFTPAAVATATSTTTTTAATLDGMAALRPARQLQALTTSSRQQQKRFSSGVLPAQLFLSLFVCVCARARGGQLTSGVVGAVCVQSCCACSQDRSDRTADQERLLLLAHCLPCDGPATPPPRRRPRVRTLTRAHSCVAHDTECVRACVCRPTRGQAAGQPSERTSVRAILPRTRRAGAAVQGARVSYVSLRVRWTRDRERAHARCGC